MRLGDNNSLRAAKELSALIKELSESYVILVESAVKLSSISLAGKNEINDALRKAGCLGQSLDNCNAALFFLTKTCFLDYFSPGGRSK